MRRRLKKMKQHQTQECAKRMRREMSGSCGWILQWELALLERCSSL